MSKTSGDQELTNSVRCVIFWKAPIVLDSEGDDSPRHNIAIRLTSIVFISHADRAISTISVTLFSQLNRGTTGCKQDSSCPLNLCHQGPRTIVVCCRVFRIRVSNLEKQKVTWALTNRSNTVADTKSVYRNEKSPG